MAQSWRRCRYYSVAGERDRVAEFFAWNRRVAGCPRSFSDMNLNKQQRERDAIDLAI
jgi:hypothetical protein